MYPDKEIDFIEVADKAPIRVMLVCCDCTACWYCNHMTEQESTAPYICRLHDKEVHPYQEPCKDFR